jgi:hypothetical protein
MTQPLKVTDKSAAIAGDQHPTDLVHGQLAKMPQHALDLFAHDEHQGAPVYASRELRLDHWTPAFEISDHRIGFVKDQHLRQIVANDGIKMAREITHAILKRI